MTPPAEDGHDQLAHAVEVMGRIRRDGQWESEQTHASLLSYLVEETWELVDAVEGGDRDEIVSELGDLLLQVLFHSAIGAERPRDPFDVHDVAASLLDKLRDRAPYWFTEEGAAGLSAQEQDRLWQEAKARRRAERAADTATAGIFDGLSWSQPALALGQEVLARARRAGVAEEEIPEDVRTVRVEARSDLFTGGAESAELAYRARLREFVSRIEESRG